MQLNFPSFNKLIQSHIFWVVLSLILVISPHLSRFPNWSIVLIMILFMWKIFCIDHQRWQAPKWLLIIISIVSMVGIFIYFGTLFGKTAGSIFLSIMLTVKLHESKSRRDYMLLVSLSFFIIVTNFLFSQSIFTVVYMLFTMIILIISLLSINQGSAKITLNYKIKFSVKLISLTLPLMLVMFVLFPRISGPLWKLPEEKQSALSGLSETMSPGDISSLIQSNALAFRVDFETPAPPQNKLYWRALVLWDFDGHTWEQGKTNPSRVNMQFLRSSKPVNYTITLEPHNKDWLYALDMPSSIPEKAKYTNNSNLRYRDTINSLHQYSVTSILDYVIQPKISQWEKFTGLNFPLNSNPETLAMGQRLATQYKNNEEIVNHVLSLFNQQNFYYTLNPPLTPGFDSVDQFLFNTKRGFCEHYASSFTLLMRAANIPARVVLGFQGGTVNPLNQVMSVRNSDAHAWSEVWLKNRGWVRVDPTAAVAPQRIEQNLQAALDADELLDYNSLANNKLIKNVLFYWEAIDNQWKQWVIGYDYDLQQKLLQSILKKNIRLSDLLLIMVIAVTGTLIIISLYIMKPWRREKSDPVVNIYNRFCKKLSYQGVIRHVYEGPVDFSSRATQALPSQKSSIIMITQLYTTLRYQPLHNEKHLKQFKNLVKSFNPHK
jgi:protein-glutamine gamma-glutamyltransferase